MPPARSQSALLVMLSADGVVDEPLRDPRAEVPDSSTRLCYPACWVEGDGVLPPLLPGVLPPMPPLPDDPLPDPDVPPPVCASANAGASPRAMTKPVTCSEKLTGTTGEMAGPPATEARPRQSITTSSCGPSWRAQRQWPS